MAVAVLIRHYLPTHLSSGPDIIASQIDVLPADGGQVSQEIVRDVLSLAHGGNSLFQISRVPEDDRGDEEVERGGRLGRDSVSPSIGGSPAGWFRSRP
jgi:hypothetical protein